jgi:hypothetical protein
MGSSFGKEAMSTLGEKTVEAVEKLRIPETTYNLTKALDEFAQQSKGPFEIRVSLDVSPHLESLTEKVFILIPLLFGVFLLALFFAWFMVRRRQYDEEYYDEENGKCSRDNVF